MRWPGIESIYGPYLRQTDVFTSDKLWEDLHTRVIEHVCHPLLLNYQTYIRLEPNTIFSEYSDSRQVLHPNHTTAIDNLARPYTPASRRDSLPSRRIWYSVGTD